MDFATLNKVLREDYLPSLTEQMAAMEKTSPFFRDAHRQHAEWVAAHPWKARWRRSPMHFWWTDHLKAAWYVLRHGEQDY